METLNLFIGFVNFFIFQAILNIALTGGLMYIGYLVIKSARMRNNARKARERNEENDIEI